MFTLFVNQLLRNAGRVHHVKWIVDCSRNGNPFGFRVERLLTGIITHRAGCVSVATRGYRHDVRYSGAAENSPTWRTSSDFTKRDRYRSYKNEESYRDGGEWQEKSDVIDETVGDFKNFKLSDAMQARLRANGINFLFPSQTGTFNPIYNGSDVIVQARTGSGKTLSYVLPLMERLHETSDSPKVPRMLVLVPVRELACQVTSVMQSLTSTLSVVSVYGGASISVQEKQIRSGVDVIVGTPGRILDFIERGTLDLSNLQHVVLDEVDRMLDMGFADSVDDILRHRYIPGKPSDNPQTLLFSATVPAWVQQTAKKYLSGGNVVKLDLVGRGTVRTATTVQHLAIGCAISDRPQKIADILQVYSGSQGRTLIFCETKRDADKLAHAREIRVEKEVLHGDISQSRREMVLKDFRTGKCRCLVATDVAARGLDIPEVDLVIQCSPPKDVDSYIHRAGRTGRAGRNGVSVVLYAPDESYDLKTVEKIAGITFERTPSPSPEVASKAAVEDAVRSIEKVRQSVIDSYNTTAESLIARCGAVSALAAAIAIISGNDKSRSLITAAPGFQTYLYRTSGFIEKVDMAWKLVNLPATIKRQISNVTLCADHKGFVFDLPFECEDEVKNHWCNTSSATLCLATELPTLKTTNTYSNFSWHSSSNYISGQQRHRLRSPLRSRQTSHSNQPSNYDRHDQAERRIKSFNRKGLQYSED